MCPPTYFVHIELYDFHLRQRNFQVMNLPCKKKAWFVFFICLFFTNKAICDYRIDRGDKAESSISMNLYIIIVLHTTFHNDNGFE